jgi:hypothetical protein
MNTANELPWQIEKIIDTANALQRTGRTGASTGEQIAAAFVLNRMEFLPANYPDVLEAWERLDDWQRFVRIIKRDYRHLLD